MGHNHHGHAVLCQLLHQLQNLSDHLRVQCGGRLIEQHHIRIHRQRAHDCNSLLLSAGELCRISALLVRQTNPTQQLTRLLLRLLLAHQPQFNRSKGDILKDGHVRKEVKLLEHHSHLAADLLNIAARRGDVVSLKPDFSAGRHL